jgi:PAS domain S-box-containing protein
MRASGIGQPDLVAPLVDGPHEGRARRAAGAAPLTRTPSRFAPFDMPSTSESDDDVGSLQRRLIDAQAKATRLDQWLDVFFETSPVAMGIISAFENRYVRANPAMAELYGVPLEEILNGDPFSMALRVTHPDELVAEEKLFAELVSGARRSYRMEKRCVRPDGSFRWALLTFSGNF